MSRPTVLVVDDSAMTRRFIQTILRAEQIDVIEAVSASTALAIAATCHADLVLLDIVLPDGNGFDLVEPLRAAFRSPVPVVAITGLISRADEGRVGTAGFDDIVNKPVDAARLRATVKAHLPDRSSSVDVFGTGRKLLLVDDDPLQRKLGTLRLSRLGFEVVQATDGRAALELARKSAPDVIVSDVLMPNIDGFELCTCVRQDPALSRVPVVLLTNSYLEEADRALAKDVGADGYVIRSPDFKDLIETLKNVVGSADRPSMLASPPDGGSAGRSDRLVRAARQLDRQLALNVALTQRTSVLSAQLSILGGLTGALAEEGDLELALDQALHACLDASGIGWGLLLVRQRDTWSHRSLGLTDAERAAVDTSIDALIARLMAAGTPRAPMHVSGRLVGLEDGSEALVVPVARQDDVMGAVVLRISPTLDEQRIAFIQLVATQLALVLTLARTFQRLEDSSRAERARAKLLASTLDAMGTPLLVIDERREATHWNRACDAFWSIAGPQATMRFYTSDQSRLIEGDELPTGRALLGENVDEQEMSVRNEGFEPRWLRVTARPVRDDDGRPTSAVAVFRDVTEERRVHARQVVNDRLASVGVLAAGIAHEINNPLTSVLAEIEMAAADITDKPRATEHLQTALDAAHRVRIIVSDMRTLSRDGTNDGLVPVDIARAIDIALRMALPHTRGGRVDVRTDVRPALWVLGNEGRLVQVFLNLVVNAAQAMPPELDSARRVVTMRAYAAADGGVRIDVSDTGTGMTPEVRARIFTPFFTTKALGTGTGLGLSICQRIVTQLGGTIDCDAVPGEGTTFRLWLPPAPHERLMTRASSPGMRVRASELRVLVVDADPFVRQAVTRALRAEHEVIALDGAESAWPRIEGGESFDLVLYEAAATGLDAIELWNRLDGERAALRARLVFLLGRTTSAPLADFVAKVGASILQKPIDGESLKALVLGTTAGTA